MDRGPVTRDQIDTQGAALSVEVLYAKLRQDEGMAFASWLTADQGREFIGWVLRESTSETIPFNDVTAPLVRRNKQLEGELNRRRATIIRALRLLEQAKPIAAALLLEREGPKE